MARLEQAGDAEYRLAAEQAVIDLARAVFQALGAQRIVDLAAEDMGALAFCDEQRHDFSLTGGLAATVGGGGGAFATRGLSRSAPERLRHLRKESRRRRRRRSAPPGVALPTPNSSNC